MLRTTVLRFSNTQLANLVVSMIFGVFHSVIVNLGVDQNSGSKDSP